MAPAGALSLSSATRGCREMVYKLAQGSRRAFLYADHTSRSLGENASVRCSWSGVITVSVRSLLLVPVRVPELASQAGRARHQSLPDSPVPLQPGGDISCLPAEMRESPGRDVQPGKEREREQQAVCPGSWLDSSPSVAAGPTAGLGVPNQPRGTMKLRHRHGLTGTSPPTTRVTLQSPL